MKRALFICLLFLGFLYSCERRTYLSDEFRNFVPYTVGQELVFESSTGEKDTLTITSIEDNRFPQGIGAPNSEILTVYAKRNPDKRSQVSVIPILTGLAKSNQFNEERVIFEILFGDIGIKQRVNFPVVNNRKETELLTNYALYDDVLPLDIIYDKTPESTIITKIYWSRSNGYVRLVQQDGTIWDLKK